MGAGAAHPAALRSLAHLQGMDRARQPALRVQRRARPFARFDDPAERARLGATGPARGARADALSAAARDHSMPADDAVPGSQARRATVDRGPTARRAPIPMLP